MFDPGKAYQHARFLSIPRAAGSDGEKRAKLYCIDTLEKAGIRACDQPFTFTTIPETFTRILPFFFGLLPWMTSLLHGAPAWIPSLILVCAAATGLFAAMSWFPLKKLHAVRGKRESANVTGHIPAHAGARRHVVYMAHYDSKSQFLPIAVRSACFAGLLACYIAAIVSHPLSYYWSDSVYRLVTAACGNASLLFGLLLLCNVTRNRSPGAADNACGAAIVLELARIFSERPLRRVRVSFLFTGAEEYNMAGAFRYMKEKNVPAPDARFINIDGVGRESPVRLIGRNKKSAYTKGSSLVKGLIAAAGKISLPLIKLHSMLGIGFDHIAMTRHGYEAITLSSGGLSMLLRIHSPRDGIDLIAPEALGGIGRLCEQYARDLDGS